MASEEGKVGVKGPLTLGMATGSVLLAQAIIGTPTTEAVAGDCRGDADCPPGYFCREHIWDPVAKEWIGTYM